jgi:hypothetical protein
MHRYGRIRVAALRFGIALVWWWVQQAGKERIWRAEERRGFERAQLLDALFQLVVFMLQLLLFP